MWPNCTHSTITIVRRPKNDCDGARPACIRAMERALGRTSERRVSGSTGIRDGTRVILAAWAAGLAGGLLLMASAALDAPALADGDSLYFSEISLSSPVTPFLSGRRDGASQWRRGPPKIVDKPEAQPPNKLRPDLPAVSGPWGWKIRKTEWSDSDEAGYARFIQGIGDSTCQTVHECLTSAVSNPLYFDRHPGAVEFFSDCADLPFVLRAYYAWQNSLPFSFSLRLGSHAHTGGHKTGLTGNEIAARQDIVGPGPDLRVALKAISDYVTTEHFRSPPHYKGTLLPDHYPVVISRDSIRPGTVMFDPDGHVAVVYRVTEDGRILYIDAHPDNSLTRGHFDKEFARAVPTMGAGFKLWRPQKLVGARRQKDGTYTGGRIELTADKDLPLWSDEQFFGSAMPRAKLWTDATFVHDGHPVEFHDYVRFKLAYPGFRYNPIAETRSRIQQICRELGYRVASVDRAIRDGIHRKRQPDRLPDNIYATKGEWEIYSTPSRDARIKSTFEQLRDEVVRFLALSESRPAMIAFEGGNLRRDLLAAYREEAEACRVVYVNSAGREVELDFDEIKARLFHLSFNPYHCVERRWGATVRSELDTCRDEPVKAMWYTAEARLRNQLVRTYGERMGWTLQQMQRHDLDIGVDSPPDVDTLGVLMGVKPVVASSD